MRKFTVPLIFMAQNLLRESPVLPKVLVEAGKDARSIWASVIEMQGKGPTPLTNALRNDNLEARKVFAAAIRGEIPHVEDNQVYMATMTFPEAALRGNGSVARFYIERGRDIDEPYAPKVRVPAPVLGKN